MDGGAYQTAIVYDSGWLFIMPKIKIRKNETFEQALRRFNRMVIKSGILKEFRTKSRFTKKSEIKRQAKKDLERKIEFEKDK